jgi:hypothetical protein
MSCASAAASRNENEHQPRNPRVALSERPREPHYDPIDPGICTVDSETGPKMPEPVQRELLYFCLDGAYPGSSGKKRRKQLQNKKKPRGLSQPTKISRQPEMLPPNVLTHCESFELWCKPRGFEGAKFASNKMPVVFPA